MRPVLILGIALLCLPVAANESRPSDYSIMLQQSGSASTVAPLDANARVPTVRLGTGTADSTTFLRGDQSWATPAGGGAPTDATYIVQTANGSLSAEQAMGALGTGLVKNTTTTGVQSIYGGTSCTNQFPRSLDASGAATCASVADADLSQSYSGVGACAANQWASTLNDNAAPTCTQPAFSNLSSTASIAQGGTTETASTEDAILVGASTTDWATAVLPSCSNATTSKLLYNSTTNAFSCGTDQTSAGGNGKVAITGRSSASLTADSYCAPGGTDACGTSATAVLNQNPIPLSGTFRNLYVWTSAAQGSGDNCAAYIRTGTCNGTLANSALTCAIVDVDQDCSDTSNTATATAGECFQVFYDEAAGSCVGNIIYSFELTPS